MSHFWVAEVEIHMGKIIFWKLVFGLQYTLPLPLILKCAIGEKLTLIKKSKIKLGLLSSGEGGGGKCEKGRRWKYLIIIN